MIWPLILTMLICAIIVWASVLKGINFQSKLVLITSSSLVIVMLVLLGEVLKRD